MNHLNDAELLAASNTNSHVETCAICRKRLAELTGALEAVSVSVTAQPLPPVEASRASLIGAMAAEHARRAFPSAQLAAAACAVIGVGLAWALWASRTSPSPATPDPRLTPGVTVAASSAEVCNAPSPKNKAVPAALERRVFEEYGIRSAQGRTYEVDYLITPALGGADDIRNLWPEPYTQTVWNAQVKDALEDYLHDMVCDGRLDLSTAQREIAGNWIAAYKKYFHTERPLE
jgi:hypothetical protein